MKALWAYEPFHQDKARIKGLHQLLKQLVTQPSHIEVGFIVTRTEPSLNLAFDVPYQERFSLYPHKLVKQSLQKAGVRIDDKKIHVVDHQTFSNSNAVAQLLKLAKARNKDLIALYTQSRHGLQRLTLGSFAETAIHQSRINLLLLNPGAALSPKMKAVFYMTDLAPASKKHFKQVVSICKQLQTRLTVFHAAEVIYQWSLEQHDPQVRAYRRKVASMQAWMEQECRRASIPCDVIIHSAMRPVTEMALKFAKQSKADLIVVAAKSSAMAALMGGSITRQIVRASKKPVLVLK